MVARRQTWKPLQLLIIFSLLVFTNQSEMKGDDQVKQSWDIAAAPSFQETSQELKWFSSQSSLIKKQLKLHNEEDLTFWVNFNKQKIVEAWMQGDLEISPSFSQTVLVLTGRTNSSDGKNRQENSSNPQQRLPVSMTFLCNQSCGLESKPIQESPQIYKVMEEPDPVSSSRTLQTPNDPILEFDHQQILMLEDDEVVRTAAASLYEKHPTVSSVQVVDPQQRFQQVKGQPVALSELSSLVLVGHGARDGSGEMRVSGYSYKDVARIVLSTSRIGQKIRTTTLVVCDIGSDRRFREALLEKLHQAGMDTELHLWNTLVQVSEAGDVLSQDDSEDGPQWRSEDQTKKVVLSVGRNGEISRRKEDGRRGWIVPTNRRNVLQDPKLYIDPDIFKDVDQNKEEELKENFRLLEAFTWGLFPPSFEDEPQKAEVNENQIKSYVLGSATMKEAKGKTEVEKIKDVLQKCYVIGGGEDIRKIIRHYAMNEKKSPTYLMVNNWIFRVDLDSLYAIPAGKRLIDQQDKINVTKLIDQQGKGSESYASIKSHITKDDKSSYAYNVQQIFLGEDLSRQDETDRFYSTWYFTASNILESVRNFRTFTLVLMAMDMDENYIDGRPNFWFKDHSMAGGGSWINRTKRGFSGSAAPSVGLLPEPDKLKLVEVLIKENVVLEKWLASVGEYTLEEILKKMKEISKRYNITLFETYFWDFMDKTGHQPPESASGGESGASGVGGAESSSRKSGASKGGPSASDVLQNCYVIGGGEDIRKIIRYYAMNEKKSPTYLMVDNWIFRVDIDGLYAIPAGKRLIDQQDKINVMKLIDQQRKGSESYASIKSHIPQNEKGSYAYNVQQIFLGEDLSRKYETDRFYSTWYFSFKHHGVCQKFQNIHISPLGYGHGSKILQGPTQLLVQRPFNGRRRKLDKSKQKRIQWLSSSLCWIIA